MPNRLSPSAALTSVENALCMIRLDLPPNIDFDEALCQTLHSLYAPLVDIPRGRDLVHEADTRVRSMYKARSENNLVLAESERKAALAACARIRELINSSDELSES
jgi:hypothetical protein